MIKTSEIRKMIHKIWPGLNFWIFTDPFFYRWENGELEKFVESSMAGQEEFIPNQRSCEEFMIDMLAEAKRIPAPDGMTPGNRALFAVFALTCQITQNLEDQRHYCCMAVTETGIKLIDPRSKTIWSPDNEKDNVIWLFG